MENLEFDKRAEKIFQLIQEDFENNKKDYGESLALAFTIKSLALHAKTFDSDSEKEYIAIQSFGRFVYSHIDEIEELIKLGFETKSAMLSLKRLTRLFSTM